jgi:hypothetical protein
MADIQPGRPYIDPGTGQEWIFEDGTWKRAEHPFIQHLRYRGIVIVTVGGQKHEVRTQVFHTGPDTETFGLALSEINLLLTAESGEVL